MNVITDHWQPKPEPETLEAKLAELTKRVENYRADLERAVERTLERRSRRDFR